jgi:hypothetical protein
LGRLENKYEDTVSEYYIAFMSMCKKVAGLPLSEEEGRKDITTTFILGAACKITFAPPLKITSSLTFSGIK